MSKPVVTFKRFVGLGEHQWSSEPNAVLEGVEGHPRLGNERIVYTSRLERIGYDDDGAVCEVETRNTIYRMAD